MSIRKVISLSFLLLAGTLILAHAVILHHHFPFACTVTHHGSDCNSHHHHNNAETDGHCDDPFCHGNFSDCALETIFVNSCKCKQSFLLHVCDFTPLPFFFVLFSIDTTSKIADDIGLPFRQNPYLFTCQTEYITRSLGLRAPPVC